IGNNRSILSKRRVGIWFPNSILHLLFHLPPFPNEAASFYIKNIELKNRHYKILMYRMFSQAVLSTSKAVSGI
ncbi:hypothetical protein EL436_16660, partial [Enterococcus faecalis]|nr:hypothetical protein [Enterococcus faecalis]